MTTLEQAHAVISADDCRLLRRVKRAICGALPTATVFLYGSVARGTQEPHSDYDILVLTECPLSVKEQSVVRDEVFKIELERGAAICMLFYARCEWDAPISRISPFHHEVERDGILL